MSPSYRLQSLVLTAAQRERMKLILDEGHNRLGLSRYLRQRGWDAGQGILLEHKARPMFRAAARAVMVLRGLPPQRAVGPLSECGRAVQFIVHGERT